MTPLNNRPWGEGRTHAQKMSWVRAFLAEVRAALPWLAMGFALGAVIEAAAAVWRAAQ